VFSLSSLHCWRQVFVNAGSLFCPIVLTRWRFTKPRGQTKGDLAHGSNGGQGKEASTWM
jgi:hypothetical protein